MLTNSVFYFRLRYSKVADDI